MPSIILISGIISALMGGLLLGVSDKAKNIEWLAYPICLLGLVLVGLWLRSYRKPTIEESPAPLGISGPLPGAWYPYAILGVGAALCAWVIYWTKMR
jgi:hypothetical protein